MTAPRALIETQETQDGHPVFAGSRVPIDFVLAAVDAGIAWPRIVASCPWLTVAHIDAARDHLRAQQHTSSEETVAPHLRTRSLLKTKRFLEELTSPGDTPRVSKDVRETARRLLLHYPTFADIQAAHRALPDLFGPVEQRQAEGLSYRELKK